MCVCAASGSLQKSFSGFFLLATASAFSVPAPTSFVVSFLASEFCLFYCQFAASPLANVNPYKCACLDEKFTVNNSQVQNPTVGRYLSCNNRNCYALRLKSKKAVHACSCSCQEWPTNTNLIPFSATQLKLSKKINKNNHQNFFND